MDGVSIKEAIEAVKCLVESNGLRYPTNFFEAGATLVRVAEAWLKLDNLLERSGDDPFYTDHYQTACRVIQEYMKNFLVTPNSTNLDRPTDEAWLKLKEILETRNLPYCEARDTYNQYHEDCMQVIKVMELLLTPNTPKTDLQRVRRFVEELSSPGHGYCFYQGGKEKLLDFIDQLEAERGVKSGS